MATYSPVLGRWTTLNDFFHLTDRPYETFRPDPDAYATPYLAQAVARRDPEPISWLPRHRRLRARLDATRTIQALARAIASATGGAASAPPGLPADLPSTEVIEEHVELRRPDDADRDLDRARPAWAAALTGLIVTAPHAIGRGPGDGVTW